MLLHDCKKKGKQTEEVHNMTTVILEESWKK